MASTLYRAKPFLLSPAEFRFFQALREALPAVVAIAPKVRLADVVGCQEKKPSVVTLGRITQKHLDFVLCDASNSRILAAVELDDSTHSRRGTAERDVFVNALLAEVGVPLLRIQAAHAYSINVLTHHLSRLLPRNGTGGLAHQGRDENPVPRDRMSSRFSVRNPTRIKKRVGR